MNTENILNSKPTTTRDALILALVLAVTAPTDEKSQLCVEMAERFATGMSEFEVASAKRDALAQIAKIEG